VRGVELGDHFAEDVVQVGAVCNERHQRTVLLAESFPVVAVHVLGVEEIAVAPPDLGKDLGPLLLRNAIHNESGGRNSLGIGFALGLDVVKFVVAFEANQNLLAVAGNREALKVFS